MKGQLILKPMGQSDIADVIQIGEECNLSNWSAEGYSEELKRPDSIQIVAVLEGFIVGFIILRAISSSNELEICNLAVRKDYQKKGVGRQLLIKGTRSSVPAAIWLEVRQSNQTAIEFYLKNGFRIGGRRKNFYTNPQEDALLMSLQVQCNVDK